MGLSRSTPCSSADRPRPSSPARPDRNAQHLITTGTITYFRKMPPKDGSAKKKHHPRKNSINSAATLRSNSLGDDSDRQEKSWVEEQFACFCFWGAQSAPYLIKHGLDPCILEDPSWVKSLELADKVAAAVCEWAVDRRATSYCHWFQPMCGFKRHGQSACVQLAMFEFGRDRKAFWKLTGKDLLRGETDGSSFPSGNLRKTHQAGAYLTIDPLSPMFLSDDCIFIPACCVSCVQPVPDTASAAADTHATDDDDVRLSHP